MLKGIPPVLSPDLMAILMRMGHGDEIVLADGNFPADSNAQRIVRADGHDLLILLDAILQLLPLDTFTSDIACVMRPVDSSAPEPEIWTKFRRLLECHEERAVKLTSIDRFDFYDRARGAYAIVATSETALYANLILKKGVLSPGNR